eukprot:1169383-Prymnesium_polylepis.2
MLTFGCSSRVARRGVWVRASGRGAGSGTRAGRWRTSRRTIGIVLTDTVLHRFHREAWSGRIEKARPPLGR